MVSEFVVGVWDGPDECEISFPETMSQSYLVLQGGCSVVIHSLANNIKCNIKCKLFCINVSIWCEVQLPVWH